MAKEKPQRITKAIKIKSDEDINVCRLLYFKVNVNLMMALEVPEGHESEFNSV